MGRFLLACCAVVLVAGCSSSSRPSVGTIGPARTYSLSAFHPQHVPHPGPARITFTIKQPSGAALTEYKRGAGPHTGIHLIIVRRDLGVIIHQHPPVTANGRVSETVNLPTPGPYRVLVDAYPGAKGAPRNFQLHTDLRVGGAKVVGRPAGPGQLNVGVLLPVAGTWRLFLQFRDRGRIITAPFTLHVR